MLSRVICINFTYKLSQNTSTTQSPMTFNEIKIDVACSVKFGEQLFAKGRENSKETKFLVRFYSIYTFDFSGEVLYTTRNDFY